MEADTIVAVVTPPGEGGVGIVRASGPLASTLPALLFPTVSGAWSSHRMRYGTIAEPSTLRPIDRGLGCLMMGPASYTGEDVFEIQCHGSPLALERVLDACLTQGCRAARPGEFTLRAFLNGRLDLNQAEAVLDVVRARTNAGLDLAVRQLAGWLTERIEPVRSDLLGILAHMEAMVDFVEDDVPPQLDEGSIARLETARAAIDRLLEGAKQGIILRDGATLAIVGSPNVGKSSIMNGLLGLDRSIVTPVAGTTRDTIEETLNIRDIPFRTIDTAGITHSSDLVEQIGVDRSRKALEGADVVLMVLDRSRSYSHEDDLVVEAITSAKKSYHGNGHKPRLIVTLNKSDLPKKLESDEVIERFGASHARLGDGRPRYMEGSHGHGRPSHIDGLIESNTVETGGLEELRGALEQAALGDTRAEFVVSNVRHQDALRRSRDALNNARQGLSQGTPLDLISFDVRRAIQSLGEITGTNVDDELLDRIFRDFCIGK